MLLFGDTELIIRDLYSKKRPWPYIKDCHINSCSHALNFNKMHKVRRYHVYNISVVFVTNRLTLSLNCIG